MTSSREIGDIVPKRSKPLTTLTASVTVGAVGAVGLTTGIVAAEPSTSVVINEIYGGGGNKGAAFRNDFVELRNIGPAAVSLDGYTLQYAAKGGNAFNNSVSLSGSIEPGQTLLVKLAGKPDNGEELPEAALTGSVNASGSAGTFALVNSADKLVCEAAQCADKPTVIDLVGWGDAKTFAGTQPAPKTSNGTSVSRVGNTGDNSKDFQAGTPTPGAADELALPEKQGPATTPSPESNPTTPDPVNPADSAQRVTIEDIQGTVAESPLLNQKVTTSGVVTAVYPTGGLNGFVIQTGGTGGATDAGVNRSGSSAVFVYAPGVVEKISIGQSVEVSGKVAEFFGQTQIVLEGEAKPLPAALEAVTPLPLTELPADDTSREKLEHMLLDLSQSHFTVTDVYNTANFGEVALVSGDKPLYQPGEVMAPGPEATALMDENEAKKILLDDGKSVNLSKERDLPISYITQEEPVRVGAKATLTDPVVLGYSHNAWRLQPVKPWESAANDGVAFENTREATPKDVGGDIQLATFNVLNYFPTTGDSLPGCTSYNDREGNKISVRGGCLARGAYTAESFARQEEKIVAAISATGADVIGLMEVENSSRLTGQPDAATATLVAALNKKDGAGTWDYIRTAATYEAVGAAGTGDAIANAIIYKPSLVKPVGEAAALIGDPAFANARNPLGQVFVPIAERTGEGPVEGKPFLFVVNHFKSKGSKDAADASIPADPVQGNARTSRERQAEALVAWAAKTAGERSVEDVFLGGDFNAYGMEPPIQKMVEAGYTNVVEEKAPGEWSYVYKGLVGNLDHVLASASANNRVTGATSWSINAQESVMLQYSRYNSSASDVYRPDVYASSDHNPAIVGLNAEFPTGTPTPADPVKTPVETTPVETTQPEKKQEATAPGANNVIQVLGRVGALFALPFLGVLYLLNAFGMFSFKAWW